MEFDNLFRHFAAQQRQLSDTSASNADLCGQLSEQATTIERQSADNDDLRGRVSKHEVTIEEKSVENNDLREHLRDLRATIEAQNEEIGSLQITATSSEELIRTLITQQEGQTEELRRLRDENELQRGELQSLRNQDGWPLPNTVDDNSRIQAHVERSIEDGPRIDRIPIHPSAPHHWGLTSLPPTANAPLIELQLRDRLLQTEMERERSLDKIQSYPEELDRLKQKLRQSDDRYLKSETENLRLRKDKIGETCKRECERWKEEGKKVRDRLCRLADAVEMEDNDVRWVARDVMRGVKRPSQDEDEDV